jgi:hypothetical protein
MFTLVPRVVAVRTRGGDVGRFVGPTFTPRGQMFGRAPQCLRAFGFGKPRRQATVEAVAALAIEGEQPGTV